MVLFGVRKKITPLIYTSIKFINWWASVKGEPELTDPFNLLINVKLRRIMS